MSGTSSNDGYIETKLRSFSFSGSLHEFVVKYPQYRVETQMCQGKYAVQIIDRHGNSCNGLSTISPNIAARAAIKRVYRIWLKEEDKNVSKYYTG